MASSAPLSLRSAAGFSLSPSSSTPPFSSLYTKSAHSRARTRPRRRGQIKAAILASLLASFMKLLGASSASTSERGTASSEDGETHRSAYLVEDGDNGRSSPRASNVFQQGTLSYNNQGMPVGG